MSQVAARGSSSSEESSQMIMIHDLVFVAWFLSLLDRIVFEGTMTELALLCALDLDLVVCAHDETFVDVVIVHRLVLELDHAAEELLNAVRYMDHLITVGECGEVTLHLVPHQTWLMLFGQLGLMTSRWTSFHRLDHGFEVGVDYEGCPDAVVIIAGLNPTPLPRLLHHKT